MKRRFKRHHGIVAKESKSNKSRQVSLLNFLECLAQNNESSGKDNETSELWRIVRAGETYVIKRLLRTPVEMRELEKELDSKFKGLGKLVLLKLKWERVIKKSWDWTGYANDDEELILVGMYYLNENNERVQKNSEALGFPNFPFL